MFTIGQVVFSKKGRDKGRPFIVISSDEEYANLVDGNLRLLEKPKKKKHKHIQITNTISEEIQNKLGENKPLLDADIKKALLPYNKRSL